MGISFLFYDFMVDLVSQKIKLFVHFVKHLVDPLFHFIVCPLLRAFQIDCKDNSFMSKRVFKCAVRDHYNYRYSTAYEYAALTQEVCT